MNTIVDFRSYTTARGVPTLVFVDMQKEYLATPRLMAIPEIEEALANCRKLLDHARANGLPVAFVRWLDRSGPFFNQSTPFAGWIEGFEPQRNEMIFERKRPSCFSSEGFAQFMEHGGKDVVLAGFAGESACLSTMVDAFHRGHHLTFVKDASASHRLVEMTAEQVHSAVARIVNLYGDVVKTDTWIDARIRSSAKVS
ncbi:MAG TPA: cysteine hydrolase [Pseudolabrys sp.]|nr:cysteine hydrolase [Pseudolabrys sp.]